MRSQLNRMVSIELTPNNVCTLMHLVSRARKNDAPEYVRINGLKTLAKRLDKAWDKMYAARQRQVA